MGVINLPADQLKTIAAIDTVELSRLIKQAVQSESPGNLRGFLGNCGTYISSELYSFERALTAHRDARAPRKREQTGNLLQKAAYDLSSSVSAMQLRVEEDQRDLERFYVDDHILPPFRYGKRLSVTVRYRWRSGAGADWKSGSITFDHEYEPRPDYTLPIPTRKPSRGKQERELEERLRGEWEHLMKLALWSVRDYLKRGGDAANIPSTFKTIPDPYYRTLNNKSADFWAAGS